MNFTWGSANLSSAGNTRNSYLDALKNADEGSFTDLITFARS